MQHLHPDSTLQGGKYKIEKVLGQGGFGITYLAEHEMLECKVAIKEFFFREYCDRDAVTSHVTLGTEGNRNIVGRFQQKFIKEAKTIFRLQHPGIIQIHDIFTENGTAYYVMEYVDGESLGELVKKNGPLPEAEALDYIRKVGDALSYIHAQNINHLDVKPSNIMLGRSDRKVTLIDFGVAKQYDAETREGTTTTPVGISHGYSPLEQYRSNGVQEFSPQSDVYSLAATLFKLLTGVTPPEAIEVQEEGLPSEELLAKGISPSTISAIEAAMQSRKKRTQSISEFFEALDGHSHSTTPAQKEPLAISHDAQVEIQTQEALEEPEEETMLIVEESKAPTAEELELCAKYGMTAGEPEAVDMGLSVKWCSCNVGASSPMSGGTLQRWSDRTLHDAHHWRLPSPEEFKELKEKCSWKWIEETGICGYLVTSPSTGNAIFLCASGKIIDGNASSPNMGFYWSNSMASSTDKTYYCMTFWTGSVLCYGQAQEGSRISMRLVCQE